MFSSSLSFYNPAIVYLFLLYPIFFGYFFHFLLCSLTLSCTTRLTQSSGLTPPPFHHVLFHPPLPPPHLPTCPGPGQSRTSPLSICPFVLPLSISCSVSSSPVSFHLSLCLRWVVELHLVLLPPPFAWVILHRISNWFVYKWHFVTWEAQIFTAPCWRLMWTEDNIFQ